MYPLFRFFRILLLCLRYRLDEFAPLNKRKRRLLNALCRPWGSTERPRGERLRYCLENLGPVFVKFGQLLSTRPDLIPPDIVAELSYLQDRVTPFSEEECQTIIEQALGQPVSELFASFDRSPLASASVAQVHAAQLKDGKDVVVKVLRPGIGDVIEQDIALMYLLARLAQKLFRDGWRLRPVEVVAEYEHTILDELNLQREAGNASQLRRNFNNSPMLYVPEVYWDYTRRNVMVMERIYGIPVTDIDALEAQNTNMKLLAERGVEIFFTQVFEHNFFHADMHPGNIFVSHNHPQRPQYIAVDMAIVGTLSDSDLFYMARNLLAIFQRDYRLVAELHIQSGWVPPETSIGEFEAAIRTVCEPVFEKPISEISFGMVLITLFQTARRFNMQVQPQLVLLQKTLLNIEGLGRQLYPELDLWKTAFPFLERWIQERYKPTNLVKELKRYAPEILEQAPHLPQHLALLVEQLHVRSQKRPDASPSKGAVKSGSNGAAALLAVAAVVTSGLANGVAVEDIPASAWVLLVAAVWVWKGRRQ